jgi:hypothetical protein
MIRNKPRNRRAQMLSAATLQWQQLYNCMISSVNIIATDVTLIDSLIICITARWRHKIAGGAGWLGSVLTGLILKVTPAVCILGATGRDFQASNTRLKG